MAKVTVARGYLSLNGQLFPPGAEVEVSDSLAKTLLKDGTVTASEPLAVKTEKKAAPVQTVKAAAKEPAAEEAELPPVDVTASVRRRKK